MNDKTDDQQAREKQAEELQAQIDELIAGKGDTQPRTLRDLTRPPKGSEKSNDDEECKPTD